MSSATLTERARRQTTSGPTPSPIAPAADDAPTLIGAGHFFVITAALLAGATAIVLRQHPAAIIVLASLTVAAAGYAAYALYRSVLPLVSGEVASDAVMVAGRTRAALERDKALTLRSLKELDFDHAMGKVATGDYTEMRDRLRVRAIRLMRQLDGATAYRAQIEHDLQARLGPIGSVIRPPDAPAPAVVAVHTAAANRTAAPTACAQCNTPNDSDARFCKACGATMPRPLPTCSQCGTVGDADARFCKHCGHALLASA